MQLNSGAMPQPHKVYINGRFLRGPITGTTRVAEEILAVWDARLSADGSLRDRFQMRLLRPARRMRDLQLTHIPQEDVHLVGGKFWELVDLPLAARDGVLVNFANIAPFIHRRGLVYVHDAQIYLYPASYPFKERTLHKLLGWLGAHAARRVITISGFSASMLERYGLAKREKISIIHNGADHILRAPEDPSALNGFGLAPRGYVLMFGSGFAYKNNRIVYEAIRRLGPQAPQLAVIGRADERSAFEDIIDQNAGKVTLVSGLSDGALRALYANALVFVAPSRTEGYPITPLEALNCGCPVITTPEGSMPEVLGDAVDYAGADDAGAWADAIMAYVREPGRRAIALSKGQPVAASKTWARAADALLHEIAQLCAD
jgi:glycosyltransferase involved in cell wall biosynthesis